MNAKSATQSDANVPAASHSVIRRALIVLMTAAALIMGFGVSAANANTVVAGHTFVDSSANCAPSALRIQVGGNTNDYSGGRYVRVVMYDYAARQWIYGPWNGVTPGWSVTLNDQFNFGHHGYYYPELQYAVATSSGWAFGWEQFKVFGQTNSSGYTSQSNYCYI